MNSPDGSVVQGSKLSGILYTLYTNELPQLHKLIKHNIFPKITSYRLRSYKNIEHDTVNFVDDSTSIIAFKETSQIKPYLTDFFNLLKCYYNINKIKINDDKTQMLLTHKPKHKNTLKNFHFYAGNDKITTKNSIKILGFYITSDLKLDSQIGKLTGQLHNRLYNLRQISRFLTFKNRLSFVKSFIIGKLIYAMPIYMGINTTLLQKVHKVIMTAARTAIGSYFF